MKKSVIMDIFNGSRGHRETMSMPKEGNPDLSIVCEAYDELSKKLSPELLSLHQKLVDALENSWADEVAFYFAEGVKLGIQIGIECIES